MPPSLSITASYAFVSQSDAIVRHLRDELSVFGDSRSMTGLVLLAPEGINATVCGSLDAIAEWKDRLRAVDPAMVFKDSVADAHVFRRWSVKIKPEIVTLKQSGIRPQGPRKHLSPDEWQRMLKRDDVIVLDTRNDYEVAIGKFRTAVDPGIGSFQDFPAYTKSSTLPKDKTVLLYCTGGIRCEKALLSMEAEGFTNVYQLQGGILGYLERFPYEDFEGECFVFDRRVAVDQELRPSKTYRLCERCGDPAKEMLCGACLSREGAGTREARGERDVSESLAKADH